MFMIGRRYSGKNDLGKLSFFVGTIIKRSRITSSGGLTTGEKASDFSSKGLPEKIVFWLESKSLFGDHTESFGHDWTVVSDLNFLFGDLDSRNSCHHYINIFPRIY